MLMGCIMVQVLMIALEGIDIQIGPQSSRKTRVFGAHHRTVWGGGSDPFRESLS
jgi:hypothetical protein